MTSRAVILRQHTGTSYRHISTNSQPTPDLYLRAHSYTAAVTSRGGIMRGNPALAVPLQPPSYGITTPQNSPEQFELP